jgi:hypothetical protein
LKPVYTAANEQAARAALDAFAASDLGIRYPATVATWLSAWERFIPFLEFHPALRRVIYTTNAIESLNYQFRKIIKNRGHFPSDTAVIKLLWLAIRDIEDKRARSGTRPPRAAAPDATRKFVEGTTTQGWNQALGALKRLRFRAALIRVPGSVECCVVGLLELFGRAVRKATVQSTVVVPVDPACRCPLDVDDAPIRGHDGRPWSGCTRS